MALIKITFFYLLYLTEAYLSNGLLSISITRRNKGDIFTVKGEKCYKDLCVGLTSGTARPTENGECECKCEQHLPVYRDDLNTCVDRLQECTLVPFVSGTIVKKIPYVFLPLKGQIINPSAEIVIADAGAPVCVVSGGQFLGRNGWLNLRNNSATEPPFRIYRDEGRTYLQWFGEATLRMAMEGRIILVHLMCKDASIAEEPKIFTPCVAFRVAGNPNVREVLFSSDVHLAEGFGGGLSLREYVAIGLCSFFLAVVYIASVFLYLHWRKQKQKKSSKKKEENAQLSLGEEGIVKNNPLLQATRHLGVCGEDNPGYITDSNSCCSESEQISDLLCLDDENLAMHQNVQTSAIIHPCDLGYGETILNQDPNSIERLPEENVSIIETLEAKEVHPETIKTIASSNGRRKLYFNPSYFEPELLKTPPPAALEFLVKIREIIAIAKHKMSNKKFSPSLLGIPEEDSSLISESNNLQYEFSEKKSVNRDQRNISSTLENEDFKSMNSHFNPKDFCCSSDAKQRIIQKWLEDVPIMMHEDDQKAKVKDSSRIKASAEDKILSNPNFWETNELDGNKTNKIKENSNEFANSAKIDRKRPSTKARPPPLPPLKPLKSLNENSPSFLPLNVQEKDDSKITRQKESVIEVKIPEKMNRTLQYETECCLTQSSAAFSTHPPHPPPLPPSNLDQKVDNFRLNEKDNIQPIFAKNLMDAVIQELTDYRKNEKLFKSKNSLLQNQGDKNLIKKDENQNVFNINERNNQTLNLEINETLCLKSECLNAKPTQTNDMCVISTNNKPREEESTKKSENKVQDEHEYEIIILNPEEGKTKNSKRLNLPEMFSVNERHEGYSLVSEVYVNDNYSCSSGRSSSSVSTSSVENEKINYKVMNEKNGRLTIHVKDSPNQHNELVCESDHFEPDTLERKQQKSKLVQRFGSKNGSDKCDKYSNQKFHDMDCTKETDNSDNNETFVDSLERPSIMLKTNGSFKRNSLENDVNELFKNLNWTKMANFGSLREIYEAKSKNHKKRSETTSLVDLVNCEADCMSTLSWNEERRNKLLHRGIVLHIDEDEGAGAKRTFPKNKSYVTKYACPEKVPSALPPKPSVVLRSRSVSPVMRSQIVSSPLKLISENSHSPVLIHSSIRSSSPPIPPPRSLPASPRPPSCLARSTTSSPINVSEDRGSVCVTPPLVTTTKNNSLLRVSSKNDHATQYQSISPFLTSSLLLPSSFSPLQSGPPLPSKVSIDNSPPLPPRNSKPPLPPKNAKSIRRKSDSSKFATRPLPPLPFPRPGKDTPSPNASNKDLETLSTLSGASLDSLNSSEYESFYTMPYQEVKEYDCKSDSDTNKNLVKNSCISSFNKSSKATVTSVALSKPAFEGTKFMNQKRNQRIYQENARPKREKNRSLTHKLEDSGYLSTDSSESYCPQIDLPESISKVQDKVESCGGQNSETEESVCDGASESGAESTATDSFFYGNFKKTDVMKLPSGNTNSQVYPYSLRLSDVEVNSDTERHCMPIMVRP